MHPCPGGPPPQQLSIHPICTISPYSPSQWLSFPLCWPEGLRDGVNRMGARGWRGGVGYGTTKVMGYASDGWFIRQPLDTKPREIQKHWTALYLHTPNPYTIITTAAEPTHTHTHTHTHTCLTSNAFTTNDPRHVLHSA